MKNRNTISAAGLVVILAVGLVIALYAIFAQSSGFLHVAGTNIVDSLGNKVILRGSEYDYNAMMGHRETKPTWDYWFGLDDIQHLKAHGGNVMELHGFEWSSFVPQPGIFNQEQLARLDLVMSWFQQEKVYTIISMSNFGGDWAVPAWLRGNKTAVQEEIDFFTLSDSTQNAVRQEVINVFRSLAQRYKNNPYVMFGLLNEPFCGSQDLLNEFGWTPRTAQLNIDYARYVEQIVDAIHNVSNKIVFVDKPYVWFYATNQPEPVNRENIVWEDHLYVAPSYNLTQWKDQLASYYDQYVNVFQKPFFVGEYGFIDHSRAGNRIANDYPDWKYILQEQTRFMKTMSLSYQYHAYSALADEWYDWYYENHEPYTDSWTPQQSEELLDIICSWRT